MVPLARRSHGGPGVRAIHARHPEALLTSPRHPDRTNAPWTPATRRSRRDPGGPSDPRAASRGLLASLRHRERTLAPWTPATRPSRRHPGARAIHARHPGPPHVPSTPRAHECPMVPCNTPDPPPPGGLSDPRAASRATSRPFDTQTARMPHGPRRHAGPAATRGARAIQARHPGPPHVHSTPRAHECPMDPCGTPVPLPPGGPSDPRAASRASSRPSDTLSAGVPHGPRRHAGPAATRGARAIHARHPRPPRVPSTPRAQECAMVPWDTPVPPPPERRAIYDGISALLTSPRHPERTSAPCTPATRRSRRDPAGGVIHRRPVGNGRAGGVVAGDAALSRLAWAPPLTRTCRAGPAGAGRRRFRRSGPRATECRRRAGGSGR
jgi:hypothetical protein